MKLKHTLSLLALASCAAVSTSAFAQSTGTLNIKGAISPVSCTPNLSGGLMSGNTLTLNDALISQYTAAGAFGGETTFNFEWTGCTVAGGIQNVWVHFDGNTDPDGRIIPATTAVNNSPGNMRFQFLNGPGGAIIKAGLAAGTQPGTDQGTAATFSGTPGNMTATKQYAVRYQSTQALTANDVGQLSAAVTYSILYY